MQVINIGNGKLTPTIQEKKRLYYLSAVDLDLGVIIADPARVGVDDRSVDE